MAQPTIKARKIYIIFFDMMEMFNGGKLVLNTKDNAKFFISYFIIYSSLLYFFSIEFRSFILTPIFDFL